MRKHLLISLFASALLLLEACVTVPNTSACAVAGTITAGAICSETQTDKTWDITFDQLIAMLEAGAIIQSADDWGKNKTALEQACRELGSRCSYDIQSQIERMNTPLARGIQAK